MAATVPTAPAGLAHKIDGSSLSLTWTAPADGGSPLTGYKLILNEGTPIVLPADATEYELALGEGTYDLTLIATNAVGDSPASESIEGLEIAADEAEKEKADPVSADAPAEAGIPLAAPLTLGGIVVVAGGLLTWWWLRRRGAGATAPATASDDTTPIL
ncbi:hypothetical protein CQ045_04525 [Microbacterium sp. MYb66]|nr:hypothetical protein CQ045_04525 [Microbacterium sp. MYb66]